MRRDHWCVHELLGAGLVLLTACSPQATRTTPSPGPAPTSTALATPSTPTPRSFPTAAFTPYPTMIHSQQMEFYDLLRNNGGCELPCFLDLTPGKTTWEEGKPFLEELARNKPLAPDRYASTSEWKVYFAHVWTTEEVSLDGHVQVDVDSSNLIRHIVLRVGITTNDAAETHDTHVSWYSMSHVLMRYGAPDAIYLYVTDRSLVYSIQLVYEYRKLVLEYVGLANLEADDTYRLCPNIGDGDVADVKLAVASRADPIDVKTLLGYPFWEQVPPLATTTGMSVHGLYRLMTSGETHLCFSAKPPS